MDTGVVIGIDGGGTATRTLAVDLDGRVRASVVAGGASPHKTRDAQENVQWSLREVVARANCQFADVRAVAAGLAGLDTAEDQIWAERFTALSGLTCPRIHVNDTVVAHTGALGAAPGVIAISGTGSNVFGVTEDGRHVLNGDFQHYAIAARHLALRTVHAVLAGRDGPADGQFVAGVLAFWQVTDVAALGALGVQGFVPDDFERRRRFGAMAPLVTAAAERGSPLARAICDQAAEALATGIALVGGEFADSEVPVVLIGSAVRSSYMTAAVKRALLGYRVRQFWVVEPRLSCEAGATLMALRSVGVEIDDAVLETLRITQSSSE